MTDMEKFISHAIYITSVISDTIKTREELSRVENNFRGFCECMEMLRPEVCRSTKYLDITDAVFTVLDNVERGLDADEENTFIGF